MTNEQVHHYFFSAIETGEQVDVKTNEGHEIYLVAEKAIEKQISMKVLNIHENWDTDDPDTFASTEGNCPSCREKLATYALQKYCDNCGQAISWEVEE